MKSRRSIPALGSVLACGLAILLPSAVAARQAESQDPDPKRWEARIDFGLTAASGNQELTVLTSGVQLTHLRTESMEFELTGQARYGRSEGEEVARNLRGGIRVDLQPKAVWSPFLFVTAERDPFRRLDLRANGGAGVKRVLVNTAQSNLSISMAALYSHQQLRAEPGLPPEPREDMARWSWRLKGAHELQSGVRLEGIVFYQPIWDRAADYLLDADAAVRVRLSQRLGLNVTYSYNRDSTPPTDVRPDDHLLQVGLSVDL